MAIEIARLALGLLIAAFHRPIADFILDRERSLVLTFRQRGMAVPASEYRVRPQFVLQHRHLYRHSRDAADPPAHALTTVQSKRIPGPAPRWGDVASVGGRPNQSS